MSLQVGRVRQLGAADLPGPKPKPFRSAIFKEPVAGPVFLSRTGLAQDEQATPLVHGGPEKAALAYCGDHYAEWRKRPAMKEIRAGGFGENFTLSGLDETGVCIGDVFELGGAVVQVSQPRDPCWKLAGRWGDKGLIKEVIRTGRSGWYFRVMQEGEVQAGDTLKLTERPFAHFTVSRATFIKHHPRDNAAETLSLAACPALAGLWRAGLLKRLAIGAIGEE